MTNYHQSAGGKKYHKKKPQKHMKKKKAKKTKKKKKSLKKTNTFGSVVSMPKSLFKSVQSMKKSKRRGTKKKSKKRGMKKSMGKRVQQKRTKMRKPTNFHTKKKRIRSGSFMHEMVCEDFPDEDFC